MVFINEYLRLLHFDRKSLFIMASISTGTIEQARQDVKKLHSRFLEILKASQDVIGSDAPCKYTGFSITNPLLGLLIIPFWTDQLYRVDQADATRTLFYFIGASVYQVL